MKFTNFIVLTFLIFFLSFGKNSQTNNKFHISNTSLDCFSKKTYSYKQTSLLNDGNWVKIKIKDDGIYKLSFDDLIDLGFKNPDKVRVFGSDGKMLSIENNASRPDDLLENKVFVAEDYILFYGKSTLQWSYNESLEMFMHSLHLFSDYSYYLITDFDTKYDNQIKTVNNPTSYTNIVTTYDYYEYREKDSINILSSGSHWFWKYYDKELSSSFAFDITNKFNDTLKIALSLAARDFMAKSSFDILCNNSLKSILLDPVYNSPTLSYVFEKDEMFKFKVNQDKFDLNITYNQNSKSSIGWLDKIIVNAKVKLSMINKFDGESLETLHFRDVASIGKGQKTRFVVSNSNSKVKIWDVTDPINVKNIKTSISGDEISFTAQNDSLHEFVAFDESNYFTPITIGDDVGKIANQNLHGIGKTDMIIVTNKFFRSEADELAQLHRDLDFMTVEVVEQNQIFNEFSSGCPDVTAIRDFMRMLYNNAETDDDKPKYLLLFGDGSYNNKKQSEGNTNYILTYQSKESLIETSSFVTDDFFGLLDDDEGGAYGMLDIGIGRLPVKTKAEARIMIDKIKHYTSSTTMGQWQNSICFIADDADANQIVHTIDADFLAESVNHKDAVFNINKVYLDAFQQVNQSGGERYPDAVTAVNEQINNGVLIVNYTGHGSFDKLTAERVIDKKQIALWDNNNLPIFVTASCEFSRFDAYNSEIDLGLNSAGEEIILKPNGGGVALLSTTRLVFSGSNMALNTNFYKNVFRTDKNGNAYRLGDIIRLSKNATGSINSTNKRNFTLLGDPALKPAYPKLMNTIKTISINGKSVSDKIDTIKALSTVFITACVEDHNNEVFSDFNGIVYITIYDAPNKIKTLGNDGSSIVVFDSRSQIFYKGTADVINGKFSFSFIIPKDISYNFGRRKISYYAMGEYNINTVDYNIVDTIYSNKKTIDASGYFNNFIVEGSNKNNVMDDEGPKIKIFFNDTSFIFGGITGLKPTIISNISDENGINATSNGIGHEIIATIDNDVNNAIILTPYYTQDINTHQSGKVLYQIPEISVGMHSMTLKAWDNFNNSATAYIEFIVASTSELYISDIYNYPNPFQDETTFTFKHNQPNTDLEIDITIYTLQGGIVRTIKSKTNSSDNIFSSILWNQTDNNGQKLERGIYLYKIKVKSEDNQVIEKCEKLIVY